MSPPVIIIRPRRAPPPRVRASIEGWLRWELIGRDGRVRRADEQHNLILDQGLNQIATYGFGISSNDFTESFAYFAVGTGSTAADKSDTGLEAEVARTNNTNTGDTITRVSDGVYDIVRSFEFDFDEANGNLAEWGVSPSSSAAANLASRELFKDTGGTPAAVTKTSDDKLRGVYTRRITLTPTAATTSSLTITNHGTVPGKYRLFGGDTSVFRGFLDLKAATLLATGKQPPGLGSALTWEAPALYASMEDLSGAAYTSTIPGGAGGDKSGSRFGVEQQSAAPAYTPGSFERGGATFKFGTGRANLAIYGVGLVSQGSVQGQTGACLGFLFDFDDGEEWTKDDLHELRVTLPTLTWSRAA